MEDHLRDSIALSEILNQIQKAYAESLCLLDEATQTDALIAALETAHSELENTFEFSWDAVPDFEQTEDPYPSVESTLRKTELSEELEDYVVSFPPYRSIVESFHPLTARITERESLRFRHKLDLFCRKWFARVCAQLKLKGPLSRLWETPWRNHLENVNS